MRDWKEQMRPGSLWLSLGPPAFILAALLLGCGDGAAPRPDDTDTRSVSGPNVLLYVTDTLRADGLGRYGNTIVETPVLDDLASEGLLFDRAYASSAWTRASIASILSGVYPDVHGAERREDVLSDRLVLVSELFSQQGYSTAAILSNPNIGSFFGFAQGFDEYIELYDRRERGTVRSGEAVAPSDLVTQRAIEWLRDAPRPFFLFVLAIDPHWPYTPPKEFDRYGGGYSGRADTDLHAIMRPNLSAADLERVKSLYYAEIAFNDHSLGTLIDYLRAEEIYDDTITIFTSDHGEEFKEHGGSMHGHSLFEEAIRVPLILRYPKALPADRRVETPVELVDIVATLLDLTGIEAPYELNGQSLIPGAKRRGAPIYSTLDLDQYHFKSITSPPWKLIRNEESGAKRLYNLDLDLGEFWNLKGQHPDQLRELEEFLEARIAANAAHQQRLLGDEVKAGISEAELPEGAVDALRALGYIDSRE